MARLAIMELKVEILYTNDPIEGEPGPNLYWKGKPEEYWQLLIDLRPLALSVGFSIDLKKLTYIQFKGIKSYSLSSIKDGTILTQVKDENVLTELDPIAWEEFLLKILALSFSSGHIYQEELWQAPLIENANVIMSSEY